MNYMTSNGRSEIINQYAVVTHSPAIEDPVVQAVVLGSLGVALAPFTGGASVGWAVAATGLAVVSAGFGIASAALQKSDPALADALGWASLGTGLLSSGTALLGSKVAARAALSSSSRLTAYSPGLSQRVTRGTLYRRGPLLSGEMANGNVNAVLNGTPVSSTYEFYSGGIDSRILYIDAHGAAMGSEHMLAPLPTTEFQFRSALGVKAADVNTTWTERVLGRTPYRHPPGATDIPNYILTEFTIKDHVTVGSLPSKVLPNSYEIMLRSLANELNADIVRPTSMVLLSDLINELAVQGYQYDRIVGNFCRGSMAYDTPLLVQSIRQTLRLF